MEKVTDVIVIKKGQELDLIKFVSDLSSIGYHRVYETPEIGEFMVRGGLITVWPHKYKEPARVELFGNKVDRIFLINSRNLVIKEQVNDLVILPVRGLTPSGSTGVRPLKGRANQEEIFLSEIKKGDYVVHLDHGVGKFLGFSDQTTGHNLVIEYAKGSKLYVPTSQINRLTKYIGPNVRRPTLSHLGTGSWERTKQKVEKSVVNMAKELLQLYALRESAKRRSYAPDSPWQQEMEDDFEFTPTDDQLKSTNEIKKDLEGVRPMDRVLVGDVGFGKTEVAIRAAFKAVQDGRQVAILTPTTVLAEQHFHTFRNRLSKFPVVVEYLSRFTSNTKTDEIQKRLENGEIDILIGTHRLLSNEVNFKNLGLLVIDEEHRFGVAQKEKVKSLKLNIDVLTLSATPIPRTLNATLTRIRDISVLAEPPLGRVSTVTYVNAYNEHLVRTAILNEIKRSGQVYYLHNRVSDLAKKSLEIKKLVPEARLGFLHGQMSGDEIEKTMNAFLDHQYDVLVSTTIIASGLDVPNANTIIVENAHKLGLADLHQLRGRVGRSTKEAYAYFFYPKISNPTPEALDRLLAIYEFQKLGSGFDIAKKDLEIRGAGNLLGKEQSGQMSLVGYELYVQLLSQAVEKLRKKSIYG